MNHLARVENEQVDRIEPRHAKRFGATRNLDDEARPAPHVQLPRMRPCRADSSAMDSAAALSKRASSVGENAAGRATARVTAARSRARVVCSGSLSIRSSSGLEAVQQQADGGA